MLLSTEYHVGDNERELPAGRIRMLWGRGSDRTSHAGPDRRLAAQLLQQRSVRRAGNGSAHRKQEAFGGRRRGQEGAAGNEKGSGVRSWSPPAVPTP